jgi:hypothetical protein
MAPLQRRRCRGSEIYTCFSLLPIGVTCVDGRLYQQTIPSILSFRSFGIRIVKRAFFFILATAGKSLNLPYYFYGNWGGEGREYFAGIRDFRGHS